ncbi:hypothetical protein [Paenibacillus agricola]|uniref:Uncharacterized protein n=1 Tax=Paenibacillus agricola TaxID=2716264 RepID=A0ABX0JFU8_9BACL|nr:hypothetical protein [Paenibacillus agricola]NHN32726.1 hypothetical protein [Paenibacillus agricola]
MKGNADRAVAKRAADRIRGIFVPDESYFDEGFNRMAYSRWMANTPEGYGVANGIQEMVQYIQSGLIAKERLKHVLVVSEGMFEDENELDNIFRLVLDIGLEQFMSNREEMELQKNLRPDDKTGILISF